MRSEASPLKGRVYFIAAPPRVNASFRTNRTSSSDHSDAWRIQTSTGTASVSTEKVSATIEASYPWLNGERHLFHERSDSRNALLVAKGGGCIVLDADNVELAPLKGMRTRLVLEMPSTGGQLHAFAPDLLRPSAQALFVAAGHAGVFRLEPESYNVTAHALVDDAWAVTLCGDVLVVGTHGSSAGAGPQLIGFDATSLAQLWAQSVPGDVWAASCGVGNEDVHSTATMLVVGGWCDLGLLAYAVTRSGVVLSARWHDSPLFVRDLMFSGGVAVAATNLNGVQGFKLSGGKFEHLWTISPGGAATGLSVAPGSGTADVVVAAFAPSYGAGFQFFGDCGKPVPCDQPPSDGAMNETSRLASDTAMLIGAAFSSAPHVHMNMTADSGLCIFGNETKHSGALRQAGVFMRGSGERFMVAMCPQLMVLPFRENTAVSERRTSGVYGNAFDSVAVSADERVLYASSEEGLATFSLPKLELLSPPAMAGEAAADSQGCIAMSDLSNSPDRLFCSAHSAGISVFSLAQPTKPEFRGHVTTSDPAQRPYSSPVPMPSLDDPAHLWLYATMGRATLSLFNVTEKDPAAAAQLATLQLPVAFVFGVAVVAVDGRQYVYVSYSNSSKRSGDESTGPTQVGILAFEATLSKASDTGVQLRALGATIGRDDQPSTVLAGGVTLDVEQQRLYVGYSCSSVVAYDISSPATPKIWSVRDLTDHMVFYVTAAPGGYVYIGLPESEDKDRTPNATATGAPPIATGMAVVDASTAESFATGKVTVLPVAWSAIAQATMPSDKSKLIVADGVSGLFSLSVSLQ